VYRIVALGLVIVFGTAVALLGGKVKETSGHDTVNIYSAATGKAELVAEVRRTDQAWRRLLTPEQYRVTRLKGTEQPFTGACGLPPKGESGVYQCVGCGTDLFRSDTKFESGTGWPSFWEPVSELNVRLEADASLGTRRTEVLCARCGAHLGHVFDDGPAPSGRRFCINAVALKLAPRNPAKREKATFAAGCFWGAESAFRKLLNKGVISTRAGYTGGDVENPTYEQVCTHRTGHFEAVEVTFNPAAISYKDLLDVFWTIHNPSRSDGQGPDIGPQYRAAIFHHGPEQRRLAEESKRELERSQRVNGRVTTLILPAKEFYPAEAYHQQYYEKRGIAPACPVF
jgi:peptide methionine sulfoxide reductase msrA/msrB